MKGLKIMTKLLKTITTIAALATTLITVSIYASAQSPVDNGSNARAEMVQNGLIAGQTAESNAFPGWIVLSTAGAAVLVITDKIYGQLHGCPFRFTRCNPYKTVSAPQDAV